MVENEINRESKRKVGNFICPKNKKIKTGKNDLCIDTFIRTQNNSFKVKATEKNIEPVKEYIQYNKVFSLILTTSNKEKEKFRFSNNRNDYHFYYYISSSDTIRERMVNENNKNKFKPLNSIEIKEITEYNANKSFGVSLNVIFQINENSINSSEKSQSSLEINTHNHKTQSDNTNLDFISYYNERIEEKVINKRKHFYVYVEFSNTDNKDIHYYSAIIELCIFNCSPTILNLYNNNYPDFLTFRQVQNYYSKLSSQQTNITKYSTTEMFTPNISPIPVYTSQHHNELNMDMIDHASLMKTTSISTLNISDPSLAGSICSMSTPVIPSSIPPPHININPNEMTNTTTITPSNYINVNSQSSLSSVYNNIMPPQGPFCLNSQSTNMTGISINSSSYNNEFHNSENYVQPSVNNLQSSISGIPSTNIYYLENGECVQSPISQSPLPIPDFQLNMNIPAGIAIPNITINGHNINSSQQGQTTKPIKLILNEQSGKNLFLNISGIDIIDSQNDTSEANNYLISYFEIIQMKNKFHNNSNGNGNDNCNGNDNSSSSSSSSSSNSDREDNEDDLDENKEFDMTENACQQIKKVFEDGSKKYFVHSSPYIIGDNTTLLYNSKPYPCKKIIQSINSKIKICSLNCYY